MAQWIKDLSLSLLWLWLLLWCGFDPWPGNFRMLPKEKRKEKEKKGKENCGGKERDTEKLYVYLISAPESNDILIHPPWVQRPP